MHLPIKQRLFLSLILFIASAPLQAGDFKASAPSLLKSAAIAWRNGIRGGMNWMSENKGKAKAALAMLLLAQPQLVSSGNGFVINDPTSNILNDQQLAARPDGNMFVVWRSSNIGNDAGYLRVVSENGSLLSNETQLFANVGSKPSLAVFNDSSAFATWMNGNNITGRLINADGTVNGVEQQIYASSDVETQNQFNQVLRLKNGNVLAIYNANQAATDYVGQEVDWAGNVQSGVVQFANLTTPVSLCSATEGPNGTIFFVDNNGQSSVLGASIFNSALAKQEGWQYDTGYPSEGFGLSNGVFANNNLLVVEGKNIPGSLQLGGTLFGPTGNILQSSLNISAPLLLRSAITYNAMTMFNNGNNALVVFPGTVEGSSYGNIYGTILDSNGNTIVAPFMISETTGAAEKNPIVITLANGNVFVSWIIYQNGKYQVNGVALTLEQLQAMIAASSPTAVSSSGMSGASSSGSSSSVNETDSLFEGSSSSSSGAGQDQEVLVVTPGPVDVVSDQSSANVFSGVTAKVGASAGSIGMAGLGFAARLMWTHYRAKAHRDGDAKLRFCDLLRKKLNLTPSDFRTDEGKEFCDAISHVLDLLAIHAKKIGAEFDINKCSPAHLEGLATIFAATIIARKLVVNINRQCKNYCLKQRVLANAKISDESCNDYQGQAFIIDVVEALEKNQELRAAIMQKDQVEMAINPVHPDNVVPQSPTAPYTLLNNIWTVHEKDVELKENIVHIGFPLEEGSEQSQSGEAETSKTPPPPIEEDVELNINTDEAIA